MVSLLGPFLPRPNGVGAVVEAPDARRRSLAASVALAAMIGLLRLALA